MTGPTIRRSLGVFVAAILLVAGGARAEDAFKCVRHGQVTYSQVPCPGGRVVGARPVRATDRSTPQPQDRALIARRALLPPQDRLECGTLDQRLGEQEAQLRGLGGAATLQDEMPLVQTRKRRRELHC